MVNEYYNYLGWGTTDENGVAHLDHDANGNPINHSYTGVGAGEIDVVASLDNPVVEGSIVSETFSVLDCMFYDDNTSASNTIWFGSNATMTRGNTYTTVKSNVQWGSIYLGRNNSQANLLANNEKIIIEMDLLDIDAHTNFNLRYNDGSNRYLSFPTIDGHHEITITPTRQIFKVDGVVKQDWTVNLPNIYLQSYADASDLEFQFKNLKVYPI